MCNECEQRFNRSETWFSKNIFYPYLNSNNNVIPYNKELGKFIISVLWRVILLSKEQGYKEKYKNYLNEAFEDWKGYLWDKKNTIKFNDIHLVFIPDEWGQESQPNKYLSRYLYRACDIVQ